MNDGSPRARFLLYSGSLFKHGDAFVPGRVEPGRLAFHWGCHGTVVCTQTAHVVDGK